MIASRIVYRQFASAIEDEILWCLRQKHNYMSRAHIENVGERVGMDRETTIEAFLRLAGAVWVGELIPEEGPPITVSGPRTEAPRRWDRVVFERVCRSK